MSPSTIDSNHQVAREPFRTASRRLKRLQLMRRPRCVSSEPMPRPTGSTRTASPSAVRPRVRSPRSTSALDLRRPVGKGASSGVAVRCAPRRRHHLAGRRPSPRLPLHDRPTRLLPVGGADHLHGGSSGARRVPRVLGRDLPRAVCRAPSTDPRPVDKLLVVGDGPRYRSQLSAAVALRDHKGWSRRPVVRFQDAPAAPEPNGPQLRPHQAVVTDVPPWPRGRGFEVSPFAHSDAGARASGHTPSRRPALVRHGAARLRRTAQGCEPTGRARLTDGDDGDLPARPSR